jgi:hypothetical protein
MRTQNFGLRALAVAAGVAVLAFSSLARADPPSRVARLGYMTGTVTFSPAGESDWVQAMVNRPLTVGDRLWADADARAEIQVGGALVRMNAGTSVSVLNFDDRIVQLQLTQGALNVRVRRLERDQVVEVATPNLAFTARQAGSYRIEVDPDGTATTIIVRTGGAEVYGEGASYLIDSRQSYRFSGTGLREYEYVDAPRFDEFDRWASDRDRRYETSVSARYVSQNVVGYQDLDANGIWRVDATYGNVWFPTRVATGWAPYRDGHWAWVDPWGWTWIDDAPWGFAVSHYGRWAYLHGSWGWVPGPVQSRAYYAPALVAFVGGANFQLSISSGSVGGVAWFPLGPREVFRPSYPVSRGYFENVNRSNTIVNTTVINNYYNNTNVTNVVYANQRVPGAVVAVPTTVFAQSQPVSRSVVRVREDAIARAPVAAMPAVAPTERSVRGAAAPGGAPPARAFEKPVVARSAPPAAPAGFAAQQPQLAAKPGLPLDDATRRQLKPAAAAPAPAVRVVAQEQKAPPTMRPPAVESAAKPSPGRGKPEQRDAPEQRGQPAAPPPPRAAEPRAVPPPAVAPPSAPPRSAQPPDQRGRPEQRGAPEQRGQPAAPPPPRAAEPGAVPPPVVAPPSAPPRSAQPPDQRGRPEPRGAPEQRGQPAAPPPPRAAEPRAVPPPAVAPPSAPPRSAQPPDQRGRPEPRGAPEQRGQPAAPPQRASEPTAAPQKPAPAAPAAAQQPAQRAQPQPAPKAEPRDQPAKPAPGKPSEKGKDSDEPKRDDDGRGPKN